MSFKHSVVVPRCNTCNGKFSPRSRVVCVECNCVVHYDCAVYECDDGFDMLCIDCYKNQRIEKALKNDGIIVKVKGDDDVRAYIGANYWDDEGGVARKIQVVGDYDDEVECEIIDENDGCNYCGWRCEYPNSHINFCGGGGCEYIRNKFDTWLDEEGELQYKEKKINPEPFESSDFVKTTSKFPSNYEFCRNCNC